MKNRLRLWIIHQLGGVDRPLPTTLPVNYPMTYSTSAAAGFTTYHVTWPPAPAPKRKWRWL